MSVSTKRALLIGANYINTPSSRLYGCIQDILNVQTMLITQYGYNAENIAVLRDDIPYSMPTKTSILNALNKIVASSSDCNEIWIHYSGHGTQIADTNGDELADKKDEVIVPCDYMVAGYISDDVLFDIVRQSKCRTLLFFDSCHSGSVCDLQYSINYVSGAFTKTQNNNKAITNPNVLMMSGCRDEQTSADTFDTVSKKAVGAFTMALINVLKNMNYEGEVMKVYNGVCSNLLNNGYNQISVLSSSVSTPNYIFGKNTLPVPPPAPTPVKPQPSSVRPPYRPPVKVSMLPLTFSNKIRPYYTTSYKSAHIPSEPVNKRMSQLIMMSSI
jgi:hypothetical protein